jgi:hypothetical protein
MGFRLGEILKIKNINFMGYQILTTSINRREVVSKLVAAGYKHKQLKYDLEKLIEHYREFPVVVIYPEGKLLAGNYTLRDMHKEVRTIDKFFKRYPSKKMKKIINNYTQEELINNFIAALKQSSTKNQTYFKLVISSDQTNWEFNNTASDLSVIGIKNLKGEIV